LLCLLSFGETKESESPPRDKRPAKAKTTIRAKSASSPYLSSVYSYQYQTPKLAAAGALCVAYFRLSKKRKSPATQQAASKSQNNNKRQISL